MVSGEPGIADTIPGRAERALERAKTVAFTELLEMDRATLRDLRSSSTEESAAATLTRASAHYVYRALAFDDR
jgi:hypothetical protein